jgi:hypothetical protein
MSPCGQPYRPGDRIGVLLNTKYMNLTFLKNDIRQVYPLVFFSLPLTLPFFPPFSPLICFTQGTVYVFLDKHASFHPMVGILKAGVQVTISLPPLKAPHFIPFHFML